MKCLRIPSKVKQSIAVASLLGLPSLAMSLDLAYVWQRSLKSYPSVQMQQYMVQSAQIDVDVAKQQYLPTPSVGVDRINSNSLDTLYGANATVKTVRLQQPLWTGGRLTAGVEKATANAQASTFTAADVKNQLLLKGLQYWSEWWQAGMKLQAASDSLKTHQALLEQVSRRTEEGVSAPVDLVLTQGRLAQIQALHGSLLSQSRSARQRLSQIVGEQIASEAVPTQLQSSLKIGDYQDMERAVMQFTPAIKKIEAQIAAQRAEVKEVGAELAPEVYVRAERSYADTGSTMSNQLNTSRVYFGFTTHLGAGLSSLQRVESIKTRMIANEMQLQDAKVNLSEQIASEWNNFDSARTRTPILIQALEATQNTFDSTARQFMAGRKSWLEVMNAAREVQQAEFDLADSKAAQIQYQWRLILMSNSLDKILETSVSASE